MQLGGAGGHGCLDKDHGGHKSPHSFQEEEEEKTGRRTEGKSEEREAEDSLEATWVQAENL